jgi:hypothetical protein
MVILELTSSGLFAEPGEAGIRGELRRSGGDLGGRQAKKVARQIGSRKGLLYASLAAFKLRWGQPTTIQRGRWGQKKLENLKGP